MMFPAYHGRERGKGRVVLTKEEKLQKVRDLRPIDDVFFEVLAQNKMVLQEMLRVILEEESLTVDEVTVQADEQNLYGRSVRLDALCTLGNGAKANVEVQRADNDNHLKRVRFNASMITVRESRSGSTFDDVVELYVVYITEFDFLKGKQTIYHVDKMLRETGQVVDDGLHEIFVNTVIDDGTDIAQLMSCFTKRSVEHPKFPVFSREVQRLKESEGGAETMCEVMQRYERIAVRKDHIEKIQKMLLLDCTKEFILQLGYSEDEYKEAEAQMDCVPV